ncbi:Leukotriene-B(4) omega-hydroxylase 2 [Seminavis robusta]|uniref:Leukotriene-B(4) omega-hydroxylase 2 n=1 Tax=Seminavis robusta TaxID=568900 RepID=A0A9N8HHF9_9STRA|nr:Leukotriene-B(4) omega-hydroxylase 2 [Seminavis robusta]|eukprot:Sro535_g161940.1 Leukotriene-B(4) omega-hydroxylase 2 (587) ;mRNA; r:17617-19621
MTLNHYPGPNEESLAAYVQRSDPIDSWRVEGGSLCIRTENSTTNWVTHFFDCVVVVEAEELKKMTMLAVADTPVDGTMILLAVAVVAATAIYVAFKQLRRYLENKKPFAELPMAKGNHFIFGHGSALFTGDFRKAFKTLGEDSANEYGQVGFWFVGFRFLTLSSVKDARTVLNAEHERRPPWFMKHFVRHFVGEKNLLMINGKEWKFHRGAVTRTFNPGFLNGSRTGMKEVAEIMVATLKQKVGSTGEELEIESLMKMITLELFGKIGLSTDFGLCSTLKPSPLVRAFEYLLKGTTERLRAPYVPTNFFFSIPVEKNIEHEKQRQLIRSFLTDLIEEKKGSLKEDDNDLLSHLVRAHQGAPEGEADPDAMMDTLMTLLFAGYDTTSVTLTFALYLLAENPEVQERCFKEIEAAKNTENVEELTYTKGVIWEALRLYPAGVRTNRVLAKPIKVSGGFVAPEGTRVNIPIWSIHHDEKYFEQPEEFRPDRWAKWDDEKKHWVEREVGDEPSSDKGIAAGDRKSMLAFSAGGRNCVGQKFASQEAIIVLATLVKGLKFGPVENFELELTAKDLILKPANGLPLIVESRA